MHRANPVREAFKLIKNLWQNRATVRFLLSSDDFRFVSTFRPGHFYSPIPRLLEARQSASRVGDRSVKDILSIDLRDKAQCELLSSFSQYYPKLTFPEQRTSGHRFWCDNPFFSYGDSIILYSFLRHFCPKRILEVGSGFSSAAMLDVNERYLDRSIAFTFVDPFPERLLTLLAPEDEKLARIEQRPVQQVDASLFHDLGAGDILFIDSSHVGKAESDVLHLLFNVLPRLEPGVILHFHDILWPFEYPHQWYNEGRVWNEAYLLRAFLQFNLAFEVLYFNSYMALHHAELIRSVMPKVLETPSTSQTISNSSLWLRKTR